MVIGGAAAVVIGVGLLSFLAAYFFFKLGELTGLEHLFLQLLMFGVVLLSVQVLGVAVYDSSFNCDIKVISQFDDNSVNPDSNKTFTYGQVCGDEASTGANSFLRLTTWFTRLGFIYLFLYLLFKVLEMLGKLPKGMRRDD